MHAHETLAALVKPDTRIVPADGRMMTGVDIAYRSIFLFLAYVPDCVRAPPCRPAQILTIVV